MRQASDGQDDFGLAMGFLDASRDTRDAQRQAEEQRRQREIRRARKIALASLVALAVTLALAGWAWYERGHAREAEATAQKKEQQRTRSLFDAGLTHAALLARGEDYAEAREVLRKTVELDPAIPEERRHTRNLLAGYMDILGGTADKVYEGAGAALSGGVAVSPDGRWLAAAGERETLVLLDAQSGELVRRLEGHNPKASSNGVVRSVVFDPEGRRLLSASRDNTMRLWDVATGVTLRVYQGHTAGLWAVARHGNTLYTAANDQTLRRWSLHTPGQWVWELPGEPISAAVAPDGSFVTVGFADGSLRAYALPGNNAPGWAEEPGPSC